MIVKIVYILLGFAAIGMVAMLIETFIMINTDQPHVKFMMNVTISVISLIFIAFILSKFIPEEK